MSVIYAFIVIYVINNALVRPKQSCNSGDMPLTPKDDVHV